MCFFNRDHNVSHDFRWQPIHIGKRDNICRIVLMEKPLVKFRDFFIVDEKDAEISIL
jgi:hypothetical protein